MKKNCPINTVICDRCGYYQEVSNDKRKRLEELRDWIRFDRNVLCPDCAHEVEMLDRQGIYQS